MKPPITSSPPPLRVALLIETSRSYGRDLLLGIAKYVRIHGPWAIEFQEGDPSETVPEWFARWKGDGVIARIKTPALAQAITKKKIQVVDLYGGLPALQFPTIRSDEFAVGRMAAQHLMDRGFRQFAFCGYAGTDWSDRRRNGFEQTVSREGFPCHVFQNPVPPIGYTSAEYEEHGIHYERQLTEWLASLPKPIGLMVCNDGRGRQVLTCCRSIGLAIPDEMAVVGVDKDEVLCELSELALSSVILNTEQIGFEAARLLDQMMSGKPAPAGEIVILPKGVSVRRSSDVLAIEDRQIARALGVIREHACAGLDVPTLLRAVPFSRSSLERRFKELLGHSPKAEILRIKLERARRLLLDSNLPMNVIAEKSGFASQEYLCRIFKSKFDMTPTAFRSKSQSKIESKS